ncbi:hypothetical protein [Streptomyces glaucescens]|uniref:hypothetical protein n=1 Tax=Streptomyces glaucescens TaxID=1907 RepID=UPI000A37BBCC|nr:hypothetical protein [Streptomyces glaucescens]
MTTQPLDLDAIEARAAHLYEYVQQPDEADVLAGTDVPAMAAEIRRLRAQVATLTTLADRWTEVADHGDAAIGTFPGPAAATLDAEVGERGRTYRKAAADVRDVLRTGQVPHDLMTDAELDTAAHPTT